MKAWVINFTGEYFETQDGVTIDPFTATEVKPMPSTEAKEEIEIQKAMRKILRKMAIDALKPTPTPTPIEP